MSTGPSSDSVRRSWACLASKKVIVSCEEIVDHDIIKASPNFTIVPGFRVNAVIEEPNGAHPAELSGYYNMDMLFWAMMDLSNRTDDGLKTWMKEWVYDLPTRAAYLEHYVERFGRSSFDRLRARVLRKVKPKPRLSRLLKKNRALLTPFRSAND